MKNLKNLILVIFVFVGCNSFAQKLFEYEFDENISLNVLEESEEGELPNGRFVRGIYKNEVFTCSSSNKAKNKAETLNETDLVKLFQGVRDGNLKSLKGTLLNEETVSIKDVKASKYQISFQLEGETKKLESYAFVYKGIIYILQFMNNESEFEKLNALRKNIVESVAFK